MGRIKEHLPVKLFTGITYTPDIDMSGVFSVLDRTFSEIERKSDSYNFSKFTSYYAKEMGPELRKLFVVFSTMVKPELLPDIKIKTNEIEQTYTIGACRRVNLDPGYISEAKMVLATTKNYSHRIYLGNGIFGDVHLSFIKGKFEVQSWTYPDYRENNNLEFFSKIRKEYLQQLGEMYSESGEKV